MGYTPIQNKKFKVKKKKKKQRKPSTKWKGNLWNVGQNYISDKKLISKIYIKNSDNSLANNLIKNEQRIWRDISPKLTYKWPRVPEMMLNVTNNQGIYKSRLQGDITSYLLEWLITKREEITSLSKDGGKKESLRTVRGKVDWCSHYGNQYGDSSNILKIKLPYGPAIPHLDIYLKETRNQKDKHIPKFIAALLHNCSPVGEWIKYMWYIYI